jgi:Excalibur calcium-binding domain
MRRIIAIAATLAVFATPMMAAGKIKANKPGNQETTTEDDADGDKVEKATNVEVYFRTCKDARAAGYHRMKVGEPGYARHLDRDNDGIACE